MPNSATPTNKPAGQQPALHKIATRPAYCASGSCEAIDRPIFKEASRGSSTSVRATGADLTIPANPGCSMKITRALGDRGNPLHVAHIAEVIDAPVRSRPQPSALPHGNGANAQPRVAICCSRRSVTTSEPRCRVSRLQTDNATAVSRLPADTAAKPLDQVHAHAAMISQVRSAGVPRLIRRTANRAEDRLILWGPWALG